MSPIFCGASHTTKDAMTGSGVPMVIRARYSTLSAIVSFYYILNTPMLPFGARWGESQFKMKIKIGTWQHHVTRYGDYEARRRLRNLRRGYIHVLGMLRARRDGFAVIHDLICSWGGTQNENRKKFSVILQHAFRRMKEDRERVRSYLTPSQTYQRLP